MACAAAIIQIEHPAQLLRMEARNLLVEKSDRMSRKLTEKLELVGQLKIDEDLDKVINEARELMGNYTQVTNASNAIFSASSICKNWKSTFPRQ